jgi:hypothetical protein
LLLIFDVVQAIEDNPSDQAFLWLRPKQGFQFAADAISILAFRRLGREHRYLEISFNEFV